MSLNIRTALPNSSLSCKDLFVNTFCLADEQNKQFIAISIWALWFRRNKLIYERINFSLQDILDFIRGYQQELVQCQEKLGVIYSPPLEKCWYPPGLGVIKVNFDTSFQSEAIISISAVVARNHRGEYIGAETYLFDDVADAFVAEVRACERAVIFAIHMGFRRVLVEGDFLFLAWLMAWPTLWPWKDREVGFLGSGRLKFQALSNC